MILITDLERVLRASWGKPYYNDLSKVYHEIFLTAFDSSDFEKFLVKVVNTSDPLVEQLLKAVKPQVDNPSEATQEEADRFLGALWLMVQYIYATDSEHKEFLRLNAQRAIAALIVNPETSFEDLI